MSRFQKFLSKKKSRQVLKHNSSVAVYVPKDYEDGLSNDDIGAVEECRASDGDYLDQS